MSAKTQKECTRYHLSVKRIHILHTMGLCVAMMGQGEFGSSWGHCVTYD